MIAEEGPRCRAPSHSGDLPFLFETLESAYDDDGSPTTTVTMAKTYHFRTR